MKKPFLVKNFWTSVQQVITLVSQKFQIKEYQIDLYSRSYAQDIADGIKKLIRYSSQTSSVLDIGVGKGWSSFLMSDYFDSIKGIDLKYPVGEQLVRMDEGWQKVFWDYFTTQKENIGYEFFDGYHIPDQESSYDVVSAIAVLEHVGNEALDNEKRIEWLKEIHRVMKPGGLLYISECPSQLSYTEFLAGILGLPRHKKKFSKKEIVQLITSNGFKIELIELTHPFIDFYSNPALLNIWNFLYRYFFRWLGLIIQHTPLNLFSHHFRVIARKI